MDTFLWISDYILFAACLFILAGSIFISFKLRFVQLRLFSTLFKMLKASLLSKQTLQAKKHTILPHRALFTAMSTTLGIGTIVGPTMAIYLGGPGALLGFLLTSFFGSATTYAEVNLCIQHRTRSELGAITGGPMPYLRRLLSPAMAKWYAVCCLMLMLAWSGAQANQLAALLDSPLLGSYRIPTLLSGVLISAAVFFILKGGIQRIGSLSAKLVPLMFSLYLGSGILILGLNLDRLWQVLGEIITSAWSPYALASGTLVGGLVSSLRWGVFKGIQANEAGIGTQTIPHSMAETVDPEAQATLAMLSTYTAGFIAFLSGCVALVTQTWQDPNLPMGISMVAASFQLYFSSFGIAVVAVSTFLFALGTILGNCYNGGHCFHYLTENKGMNFYFLGATGMVFLGAVAEVKLVWSLSDIIVASMALPHMFALVLHTHRSPSLATQRCPLT